MGACTTRAPGRQGLRKSLAALGPLANPGAGGAWAALSFTPRRHGFLFCRRRTLLPHPRGGCVSVHCRRAAAAGAVPRSRRSHHQPAVGDGASAGPGAGLQSAPVPRRPGRGAGALSTGRGRVLRPHRLSLCSVANRSKGPEPGQDTTVLDNNEALRDLERAADLPLRGIVGGDPDREGLRTGLFMVRGGVKARGHAREDCSLAPLLRHWDEGHGALTPPRPAEESCATPAMATATASASRVQHFAAMSDSLLVLLAEEAFWKGLSRVSALLEDLLVDRQAEQPAVVNPAMEAMLPF